MRAPYAETLSLYWEAAMRVAWCGPRLWSQYHLGNALTARAVEGRVNSVTEYWGVLAYEKETRQRALFRKEIASQNSWKTTKLTCKSSDVDVPFFFERFWCVLMCGPRQSGRVAET